MQITSMGKVGRERERERNPEKGRMRRRKRRNKEHAIKTFCFLPDQTNATLIFELVSKVIFPLPISNALSWTVRVG